jgi:hypothetical protein
MAKINETPHNTIFIHGGEIHFKLNSEFPYNAVNLATSEPVRITSEVHIVSTWNELHAEIARVMYEKMQA